MAGNALRGVFERLGNRVTSTVWQLGFAARFLAYMLLHSGTALRRFSLTIREIYFSGVLSLVIIMVSGLFVGMVLGLQGYNTLERYGSSEALGVLVALSLVRELGPVVAGLLFASRAGSAITAEIEKTRPCPASSRHSAPVLMDRSALLANRLPMPQAPNDAIRPMTPARNSSATTSMIPEPQMPVIPVSPVASANPGSSDHSGLPMTRKRGSSVWGSTRTRSMAPARDLQFQLAFHHHQQFVHAMHVVAPHLARGIDPQPAAITTPFPVGIHLVERDIHRIVTLRGFRETPAAAPQARAAFPRG